MSLFCKLFGHTWIPVTLAPSRRWHTTKDGHTLHQDPIHEAPAGPEGAGEESAVRHLDRCVRCGTERDAGRRRHDADRVEAAAS